MNTPPTEYTACVRRLHAASGWAMGQVKNQGSLLRERLFTPRLRVKSYDAMNASLLDKSPAPDTFPSRESRVGRCGRYTRGGSLGVEDRLEPTTSQIWTDHDLQRQIEVGPHMPAITWTRSNSSSLSIATAAACTKSSKRNAARLPRAFASF